MKNEIPTMTDPLSCYWKQPKREEILIDDNHALMEEKSFKQLAEYSTSIPSGAYEGKMWKASRGKWFLCWYSAHENPDLLKINYREIILV